MLNIFVILYLMVTIAIGLYASRRVHSSTDYVVAGRRLPLYITTATVFATWFGSETILGTSATFQEEGLVGIIADPFGASLCLILVGVFYARKLYRKNLLTISDYYKERYGKTVEIVTSLAIMLSYLGWVSAQMIALGIVFSTLSGGSVTPSEGIFLGATIVIIYTLFGGMWSVALTDFMQMTVIVIGMAYILFVISDEAGGLGHIVEHAASAGKLNFFPEAEPGAMLAYFAAFITMALGSIPQQDVFQRVTSAKDEDTAAMGGILGGSLYLVFAFIPITLAYSANLIDPDMVGTLLQEDSQQILPTLILTKTPLVVQILFYGALLSAIMSTASGTLLAPSSVFTENVLKRFLPKLTDTQFLWTLRTVVVVFGCCVAIFALQSDSSIFEMVENAYKVTLVGAFVPLTFGLYWQKATNQGAIFSMFGGILVWVGFEIVAPEGIFPPQLAGFVVALVGMVVGSLLPQWAPMRSEVVEVADVAEVVER